MDQENCRSELPICTSEYFKSAHKKEIMILITDAPVITNTRFLIRFTNLSMLILNGGKFPKIFDEFPTVDVCNFDDNFRLIRIDSNVL